MTMRVSHVENKDRLLNDPKLIAALRPKKMYWYQDFFSLFPLSMVLI
jgi:hypothetical protein